MTPLAWSLLLASIGIFGIYLAGRKSWVGWGIGLAAQVLWIVYAVATGQYGFIISALGYGAVYAKNLRAWTRKEGEEG